MPKTPPSPVVVSSLADPSTQNLAKLRTHWKWAAFGQFFFTFAPLFKSLDGSLTDIEDDLVQGTNHFLPLVMARLLRVLSGNMKISWQPALRREYARRDPDSNPIGPDLQQQSLQPHSWYYSETGGGKGKIDVANPSCAQSKGIDNDDLPHATTNEENWLDLPMLIKLDSLHRLIEWQFEPSYRLRTAMKSKKEVKWRIEPIGHDAKSNAYWVIGDDRLWIQRAHPTCSSSALSRQPSLSPTKSWEGNGAPSEAVANLRSKRGLGSSNEGLPGTLKEAQPSVEWETICVTFADWEDITERFKGATDDGERALYTVLRKKIGPNTIESLPVRTFLILSRFDGITGLQKRGRKRPFNEESGVTQRQHKRARMHPVRTTGERKTENPERKRRHRP
ncbi:hypothetical protein B0H13DRAFT_1853221 [Mycena leptocephala]|nr:hypothetical protein B0H13DRAFT_1853221 [Mycena leptocephala]